MTNQERHEERRAKRQKDLQEVIARAQNEITAATERAEQERAQEDALFDKVNQ